MANKRYKRRSATRKGARRMRGGVVSSNYGICPMGNTTVWYRKNFNLLGSVDRPFQILRVVATITAGNQPALVNVRLYDPEGTDSVKSTGVCDVGQVPKVFSISGTGRIFQGSTKGTATLVAIDNLKPSKTDTANRDVLVSLRVYFRLYREELQGQQVYA